MKNKNYCNCDMPKYNKQTNASTTKKRRSQYFSGVKKAIANRLAVARGIPAQIPYGYPGIQGSNVEKKSIDFFTQTTFGVSSGIAFGWNYVGLAYAVGGGVGTPSVGVLNNIGVGSGVNQRIGRKITMKSLFLRGYYQITGSALTVAPGRLVIVYDRQVNATIPAQSAIFNSGQIAAGPNPTGSTYGTLSLQNLDYKNRFKVLHDEVLNPSVNENSICYFDRFINLPQDCKNVEFNINNGGGIGDISTGAIYALFYSVLDNLSPANQTTVLSFAGRVRFTDD